MGRHFDYRLFSTDARGVPVRGLCLRRSLRLRRVPWLAVLTLLRRVERRRAAFGESCPRPTRLSRMPAFGLKGGVGRVTLPTLRLCLPL
ncbi:MAG: hypothetical protein ACJ74Q_17770 [Pyrinomonadaceae bacterium]